MGREYPRNPDEGGRALIEDARRLFHTDRPKAIAAAEAALTSARAAQDLPRVAEALSLLVDAARIEGRVEAAAEMASQALACAEQSGDTRQIADAFNNLGLLAWHQGRFDQATERFRRSLELRERLPSRRDVAATCNNLSLVYWEKGDLPRAMDFQQRSLALREAEGDRYGMSVSQLNLGLIYVDLGDWDKALESYFRALAEKEVVRDLADMALCYNNIGEVYLKRGRLERARVHLEKALELACAAPSKWAEAEVHGNLGELTFALGDLVRARAHYEQDRALCAESDDREELAETLRREAQLDLAEGRLDEARRRLEQALELCAGTGALREEANVRRVMGGLHAASGEPARARAELSLSVAQLRRVGRNYELGLSLFDLGRLDAGSDQGQAALVEAKSVFDSLGIRAKAIEAESLLRPAGVPAGVAALPAQLAGLACRGLDAASFCREALESIGAAPGVGRASIVLRDGQVVTAGGGGEPRADEPVASHGLEAGGVRYGTLLLWGCSDHTGVDPLADILALGLVLAAVRPAGAPECGVPGRFAGIVGSDSTLREVFRTVQKVAETPATVLVLGESGTGKELVARKLHELSGRPGAFVAVSCAAIPETLLEAELFGVARGTATGVAGRKGKLGLADRGTLFLDEVGDMSLGLQAKLLRVIQERAFEPVGGRSLEKVDARLVAATNRDLKAMMAAGEFRADLFYRLNVITITVPPLRERGEDIPALVSCFVRRFSQEYAKPVRGVTAECMGLFTRHDWPGNVRQLENVIERGVILCQGELVETRDLPPEVAESGPAAPWREERRRAAGHAGAAVERGALLAALENADWVVKRAALNLGVSRRQLYRLMDKHGLRRPAR